MYVDAHFTHRYAHIHTHVQNRLLSEPNRQCKFSLLNDGLCSQRLKSLIAGGSKDRLADPCKGTEEVTRLLRKVGASEDYRYHIIRAPENKDPIIDHFLKL